MLHCDTACFESHSEAVGRTGGCNHCDRRLAVAAIERLHKVGLFGLRRQTGRRTATLHVDNDERQLGHHCQADTFALERQTGAGSRGDSKVAGKRSTDCGADTGYLIFHLTSLHTEVLALCKFMQDVGCGSNGIRTEEEGTTALLGCHDQTPRGCSVTVDIGIYTRTRVFGLDAVGRNRCMDIMTVVESGLKHFGVGFEDSRFLGKFLAQMMQSGLERTVEEPAYQAKGEDIAALEHALVIQTAVGESSLGHCGDRHLYYLSLDTELGKRIFGLILRLLQIGFFERVDVDDDNTAGLEMLVISLERCRIHGDEHIACIAGSVDTCSDTYLDTPPNEPCGARISAG